VSNNSCTILLVEDDSNDVLLLQRAFRRAEIDHELHVVNDGEQAMCYLGGVGDFGDRDKHPLPALMLLDLKMPRRTGLEVLAWLRDQPDASLKKLPVIVLTSSRQSEDIDRAYELGANSYMAKPTGNFDGLAQMVKNATQHCH
jgi:CheY-like chemotaxis protein